MLSPYHLPKFGWKDIVLLERDQLTSGTTWHAAGLMDSLVHQQQLQIKKPFINLYKELEKKTGYQQDLNKMDL
ncbi:MAG: hypothetical protein CM1200mP13_06510 [Candidatus Pelagibacterales bacterium]|nr:MAG: hypothetical protein CM1200mP13_06510 [Pelagibacterales bacterium]